MKRFFLGGIKIEPTQRRLQRHLHQTQDTKEEHSMAASRPAAAKEQWRMLYNTVRSVRPLIPDIFHSALHPGFEPKSKNAISRFFRVGS